MIIVGFWRIPTRCMTMSVIFIKKERMKTVTKCEDNCDMCSEIEKKTLDTYFFLITGLIVWFTVVVVSCTVPSISVMRWSRRSTSHFRD